MPTTVFASGLGITHHASSGMTLAFPDVCKTPGVAVTAGTPIPYPNIAVAALAQKQTAQKTKGTTASKVGPRLGASTGSVSGMVGGVASQVNLQSKAAVMQLDTELSHLHARLRMLPATDPNQWQSILEQYVAAAAALYLLKRDD